MTLDVLDISTVFVQTDSDVMAFGGPDFHQLNINILGTHRLQEDPNVWDAFPPSRIWTFKNTQWYIWTHFFSQPGIWDYCYSALQSASKQPGGEAANLPSFQKTTPWKCARDQPGFEPPPDENCPIILDVQMDGYSLVGAAAGVEFDIDADGALERVGWTSPGDDDAFLAWDRDENGTIDDGSELFGWATLLASNKQAGVGCIALAELDQEVFGGNSSGFVDPQDANWSNLRVWRDSDHDGLSQPGELSSLDLFGIERLEYRYGEIYRFDDEGNLFRYASEMRVQTAGQESPTSWPTYDIVLDAG